VKLTLEAIEEISEWLAGRHPLTVDKAQVLQRGDHTTVSPRGTPMPEVKPGQLWRHRSGGLYQVHTMATLEADLRRVVIYREAADPKAKLWVRPLDVFMTRFEFEAANDDAQKEVSLPFPMDGKPRMNTWPSNWESPP
jgi:hypothetical protein